MSLETPTTQDLAGTILAQLEAALNQSIPLLPRSFLRVLAKTLAGVFILLYKYAGFSLLQSFVRTASFTGTEVNGTWVSPLIEWGNLIGVGDPVGATTAELLIEITVENQGEALPAGSQLLNTATGVTYITIGAVLLNAATVSATMRAVSDQTGGGGAGVIGNLDPGAVVSFANPLPDIARAATVLSQVATAADAEAPEVYRQRVLDRYQKRLQGGAYADYEAWGEETAGILNTYPYTGAPGEVDVYSEATAASSGDPDGIPTVAQLEAVLASITVDSGGLASRRNANTFVNSLPIARTGFNVLVSGITGVDSLAEVQAEITTAATEYFLSVEPFIVGLSIPPRRDQLTRTRLSAIVEDLVTAAGGTFVSATFVQTGGAGALEVYALGEGEKAKASAVAFA